MAGMPNARPMYQQRLLGIQNRRQYQNAAGEAAALTALAPSWGGNTQPYYQSARNDAQQDARQQTVMHYQIRREMAQDEFARQQAQQEQVRDWAKMALDQQKDERDFQMEQGKFRAGLQEKQADREFDYKRLGQDQTQFDKGLGLRERAVDLDEDQLAEQQYRTNIEYGDPKSKDPKKRLGLKGQEQERRSTEFDREMDLKEKALGIEETQAEAKAKRDEVEKRADRQAVPDVLNYLQKEGQQLRGGDTQKLPDGTEVPSTTDDQYKYFLDENNEPTPRTGAIANTYKDYLREGKSQRSALRRAAYEHGVIGEDKVFRSKTTKDPVSKIINKTMEKYSISKDEAVKALVEQGVITDDFDSPQESIFDAWNRKALGLKGRT